MMNTPDTFKEAVMAAAQEQIEQAIKIYSDSDELTESQQDYAIDLASRLDFSKLYKLAREEKKKEILKAFDELEADLYNLKVALLRL